MRRYRRRHRFMIQAVRAKESDKDRRKIWNDSRVENLDSVQCIRLFTLKASRQRSGELRSEEASSNSETGESETASPQEEVMNDEEKSIKINELNKQINNKLGFFTFLQNEKMEFNELDIIGMETMATFA
uniref:Uncharacterized protein n=1 Tax=Elaeophora elaphi TaxID=1147741 RepID=A0A0R3RUY7_9BILA